MAGLSRALKGGREVVVWGDSSRRRLSHAPPSPAPDDILIRRSSTEYLQHNTHQTMKFITEASGAHREDQSRGNVLIFSRHGHVGFKPMFESHPKRMPKRMTRPHQSPLPMGHNSSLLVDIINRSFFLSTLSPERWHHPYRKPSSKPLPTPSHTYYGTSSRGPLTARPLTPDLSFCLGSCSACFPMSAMPLLTMELSSS